MNYAAIYERFVEDRRLKERSLDRSNRHEWQRHHIIPRSMAGDNTASNIIKLTHEDHFFAHLLLAKIHGGKLWNAFYLFLSGQKCSRILRKRYAWARKRCSSYWSHRLKGNAFFKGRRHSPETREKLSRSHVGNKPTIATKTKMSETRRGNKNRLGVKDTAETKEKMRRRMIGNSLTRGRRQSPEERSKRAAGVKRSWTDDRRSKRAAEMREVWARRRATSS